MKNLLLKLTLCIGIAILSLPLGAQSLVTSGTVVDTDGMPVIGAGVMVVGQSLGTITDESGRWTLELPNPNVSLEFSSMGYNTVVVAVAGKTVINVTMSVDSQFLDEVVVVGYGTQKKVNLTGSVAMIGSEEMAARPISNVTSGLQGMLPGVTVVNATGEPGNSNTTIRVRGIGTIGNANSCNRILGVAHHTLAVSCDDIVAVQAQRQICRCRILCAQGHILGQIVVAAGGEACGFGPLAPGNQFCITRISKYGLVILKTLDKCS